MLPQLIGCRDCYKYEADEMYFMIDRACLLCGEHFRGRSFEENYYHVEITKTVLHALRFICLSDINRLFNFKIGEQSQELLNEVSEKYILTRLSRGFKTLDFYHSICAEEQEVSGR